MSRSVVREALDQVEVMNDLRSESVVVGVLSDGERDGREDVGLEVLVGDGVDRSESVTDGVGYESAPEFV